VRDWDLFESRWKRADITDKASDAGKPSRAASGSCAPLFVSSVKRPLETLRQVNVFSNLKFIKQRCELALRDKLDEKF